MKNPFMAMWLSTMNSSLKATRAFWASILHPHGPEEKDSAPGTSGARAPVKPDASAPKPSESQATEPVESKAPETPEPSASGQGGASREARTSPSKEPTVTRPDTAAREKRATGQRRTGTGKAAKAAAEKSRPRQKQLKSRPSTTANSGSSEVKYRNPHDPSQTWSGRGRRPRWLTEALEAGHKLDDLQAGNR